ncbi:MMPL domain-containing protein [Deinococcus grandis]|uniref:MMPL domain-containing protein n=1 Tax=Deinococcus grandis TaxID=57498 RepID=A0A100HGP4_9DEIO|nr:MMPL family transporter [Deinococcus grandis]BBN96174.1 membrane protein [Deinococcus grandis]GAQ20343.1 MMPL domain-containing protein [Deinococcus grandis]
MRTLGRLVSRHPWAVLLAWLLAAALSLPFAARAPAALTADPAGGLTGSEATRVTDLLRDRFGERDTNTVVLVTRSQPPLGTPQGDATYQRFLDGLEDVPGVTRVTAAQSGGPYRTRSEDGTLALTLAQIPLLDGASDTLRRVRAYTARTESAALDIRVTGGQAIADDFTHFAESDTKRSELVALPLIGALLLVVFGALVATGLPLAVGVLSISVAMAALYGLTHVMDVSTFAQSVITMLGLGAGIDYALLMVNRFREELNKDGGESQTNPTGGSRHNDRSSGDGRATGAVPVGRESEESGRPRTPDPRRAAERTVQTAGRSVAFSGLTVAIAMAGLILPPIAFVRSIGIGGVLAVLLTVLASLTALPALLALLGDRVNHPRFTRLSWAQSGAASGAWTAFARRVTARPWIAVLSSTAFLLLLASPALNIRTGYAGAWGLTPGVESRDTLKDVEALGAGGLLSQFEVILDLKGQRYTPQGRAKFQALVTDLRALPGVKGVLSPFLTPSDLAGTSASSTDQLAALSALTTRSFSRDRTLLRVTVIPDRTLPAREIPAFERQIRGTIEASGYAYLLGGAPVGGEEFSRAITDSLPTVVLAVFAGTFLLLMVAFRSLLIPLKSILMNALTVGAAIGLVTLIVQEGVLAAPLGIPGDVGVLDASLPVLLFAVMFGLSMDYEIFLLSRVQEEYLAGHPNDEAVVLAVGHTARIITSAAIIMFIVFSAFIFGRVVASKSIGLGLAIAVALDATLVRLVLVPAFLKLAGKWNWWLPAWLDKRLPHIRLEH